MAADNTAETRLFTDIDFSNTICEMDNIDVDGWDFFVEAHGVAIYRQYDQQSGLYHYKIFGEFEDVTPDVCAQVYMDLDYRKEWDSYVKELSLKDCDGKKLIYWNVNYPFPLANRDYLYGREYREIEQDEKKFYLVLAKPMTSLALQEKKGVVRVSEFEQSAALVSNGKHGTKAYMRYYDNPGGNIPTWLINWGAKTGVPQFLKSLHKACKGYPEYLRKKELKQKS